MSKEALDEFLSRTPDSVSKNCRVESFEESPIHPLLHISMDTNITEMVPRISTRQMSTEDRTTPRVVGAPTLYGCILAYQSVHSDYLNGKPRSSENKEQNRSMWKNGYKIYSIPYEYCLKPSPALVPDVKNTDETWLVAYSAESRSYKPVSVGRVFCTEINAETRSGERPVVDATVYVEVTLEEGIYFSKNHKLSKGYWKIDTPIFDIESWKNLSWRDDKDVVVEEIKASEFFSVKRSVADLLSLKEDKVPAFLSWR